jgi:precorrin-6x reductase
MPRVLILGGTAEARMLAERLAGRPDLEVTLSLAGRTASPARQPVPVRRGGFGGAAGLADYLVGERIAALIDATHPYANIISANAVAAAREADVPSVALRSPATTGSRSATRARRCARWGKRRAASSSRSAARSWRRSRKRRSTNISSAASIRSIRRCRCRT